MRKWTRGVAHATRGRHLGGEELSFCCRMPTLRDARCHVSRLSPPRIERSISPRKTAATGWYCRGGSWIGLGARPPEQDRLSKTAWVRPGCHLPHKTMSVRPDHDSLRGRDDCD